MSQEIVYTSAPHGLKPGSRGFCTVASTSGMAVTLAERLESLSGYRHLFPPQEAQARLNPVAFAHLQFSLGGRSYFVLSRIADAGLDYSQRSNKIAHHLALLGNELNEAGPAWTLNQPGFMVTGWDGPPRILAAGRVPPPGASPPRVCSHWGRMTGDPGWAGALAETLETKREVFLVYAPGQELLPLLDETLALIAPAKRWEATFSTFYLRLPPGVTCQWKGVIAGSEEAIAAKRLPSSLVLDLTSPLGSCPDSKWVAAARSGQISHPAALPARISNPQPSAVIAATVLDTTPDPDLLIDDEPRVALPPHRPPSRTVGVGQAAPPVWTPPKAPSRWPMISACLFIAAMVLAAVLMTEHYWRPAEVAQNSVQENRYSPHVDTRAANNELEPIAEVHQLAETTESPNAIAERGKSDARNGDLRPTTKTDDQQPTTSDAVPSTPVATEPSKVVLKTDEELFLDSIKEIYSFQRAGANNSEEGKLKGTLLKWSGSGSVLPNVSISVQATNFILGERRAASDAAGRWLLVPKETSALAAESTFPQILIDEQGMTVEYPRTTNMHRILERAKLTVEINKRFRHFVIHSEQVAPELRLSEIDGKWIIKSDPFELEDFKFDDIEIDITKFDCGQSLRHSTLRKGGKKIAIAFGPKDDPIQARFSFDIELVDQGDNVIIKSSPLVVLIPFVKGGDDKIPDNVFEGGLARLDHSPQARREFGSRCIEQYLLREVQKGDDRIPVLWKRAVRAAADRRSKAELEREKEKPNQQTIDKLEAADMKWREIAREIWPFEVSATQVPRSFATELCSSISVELSVNGKVEDRKETVMKFRTAVDKSK